MVLGVQGAMKYRTHDLRRGHADDLREMGASLYEILSAVEWSSPAFLKYLDLQARQAGAVLQAHVDESSSEDGDENQMIFRKECQLHTCSPVLLCALGLQPCGAHFA